jgi:hypothetical protein
METTVRRHYGIAAATCGLLVCSATLAQDTTPDTITAQPTTAKTEKVEKKSKTVKAPKARGTAYIRVLHAIPGGLNVDVFVDGQKSLSDIAFKSLSDYMVVPSGQRTLTIRPTGKSDILLAQKKAATADKYYTVAAVPNEGKPVFVVQNESTGKIAANKGYIRMFHLAQGALTVDVTIPAKRKNATGFSKLANGLIVNKSRARGLAPGTYNLQIRANDKLIKEVPGVQIEADKRYSIFAVGKVGGTGNEAFDVIVKPAATR